MSVRIIAGEWKGRKLEAPPGEHTRPLLGRIKQSLFDSLGQYLNDLRVADVCAGSGSFGFEAASRGAQEVIFCENNKQALQCLEANKATLKNPSSCIICPGDFQKTLSAYTDLDLIYADPPFPWYQQDHEQLLELMEHCANALSQHGRFLMRGETGFPCPQAPAVLNEIEHKAYGRSWIKSYQLSK